MPTGKITPRKGFRFRFRFRILGTGDVRPTPWRIPKRFCYPSALRCHWGVAVVYL